VLADWLGTAALEIRPVVRRLREILLASPRLFADETTLPVLDPGRGKVKKGYAWALARDDRPWGGTDPPAVGRSMPGRCWWATAASSSMMAMLPTRRWPLVGM
jgi:hypothetical protein